MPNETDSAILIMIMTLGCVLALCVLINGIGFLWDPKRWARSRWSLYSPMFLSALDTGIGRSLMRFAGLGFIGVAIVILVALIQTAFRGSPPLVGP